MIVGVVREVTGRQDAPVERDTGLTAFAIWNTQWCSLW